MELTVQQQITEKSPGSGVYDAVVLGAGFGGLAAALRLSELGARVAVCEALTYPGGCASTFEREGFSFESGATLFSGLGDGQLFRRWIDRYGLDVQVDWLDPVVSFRTPDFALDVPGDRDAFLRNLSALPGAPVDALRKFFALQGRVANALWPLLEDPDLLPPFNTRALMRHARSLPSYAAVAPWVGKPVAAVLERFGLGGYTPLRSYLEGLCRITVQTGIEDAEAPFALSCMDYYFRGTGHVRGGIGRLANGLVHAIRGLGGDVFFADRVRGLERTGDGWRVTTRRGELTAGTVVANLLPGTVGGLLGEHVPAPAVLQSLHDELTTSWSAAMLYLVVPEPDLAPASARHLQLVQDEHAPFLAGNHLFCSIGDARDGHAPPGYRSVTVSTHVPAADLGRMPESEIAAVVDAVQTRMRVGLETLAPEWFASPRFSMTASPRTFERFTRRDGGRVGGIPRRAGLHNYRRLGPVEVLPGLYLVGDTVFPGQSTLATAVGGVKVAEAAAGRRGAFVGRKRAGR